MLLSELPAAIHALLEGQSASVAGAPAALAFDAWATVAAEPLDDPNVEYERYIYEAGPDRPGTWIFAVSREIGFHDGNDEYVETKYLSYLAHFDRAGLPADLRRSQVERGPGPEGLAHAVATFAGEVRAEPSFEHVKTLVPVSAEIMLGSI